jgi:hypothetical protein
MQGSGKTQRDCAIELVDDAESFTDILEPDELHLTRQMLGESIEFGEFDKAAGGNNPAQPGGPACREHSVGAGRMIEHRRNPPGRLQREEGERGANRIRQHQADRIAGPGAAREPAAEHEARGDRAIIGERRRGRVLDDAMTAAMCGTRLEQRGEEARRIWSLCHHFGHDVVKSGTRLLAARAPPQLSGYRELARREDRDRHFWEPAPAQSPGEPRERGELNPVEAHRQHHRVRLVGDQRRTVIDFHQRATGDVEAAFREYHAAPPFPDRLDQRLRRHWPGRLHRKDIDRREKRADPPALHLRRVDREDRQSR